jgi:nicotinamide-nucleotide amidase
MMVIELGRAAPLGDWFAALGPTPAFRGGISLAERADLSALSGPADSDDAIDRLRHRFGADWLLLVDEYPSLDSDDGGPASATEVKIVLLGPDGKRYSRRVTLGGHPAILQQRIAKTAMAWMRKVLRD